MAGEAELNKAKAKLYESLADLVVAVTEPIKAAIEDMMNDE